MGTILSIVMLAALVALGGAFLLWRRGNSGRQVVLLLVLAAVLIANVLIWALPGGSGTAPINRTASGPGR